MFFRLCVNRSSCLQLECWQSSPKAANLAHKRVIESSTLMGPLMYFIQVYILYSLCCKIHELRRPFLLANSKLHLTPLQAMRKHWKKPNEWATFCLLVYTLTMLLHP